MQRVFIILLILITACESAESPKLNECRLVQDDVLQRISMADSALQNHLMLLREKAVVMSTDTLLATDSLRRLHYSKLKESASMIEYKLSELHVWHDHLILLPSKEEISGGIRNPFGVHTGDDGILQVLNSYSDTLSIIESSISQLITATSHE
jgi:hypothetical protein